jgi:hypothetical protein
MPICGDGVCNEIESDPNSNYFCPRDCGEIKIGQGILKIYSNVNTKLEIQEMKGDYCYFSKDNPNYFEGELKEGYLSVDLPSEKTYAIKLKKDEHKTEVICTTIKRNRTEEIKQELEKIILCKNEIVPINGIIKVKTMPNQNEIPSDTLVLKLNKISIVKDSSIEYSTNWQLLSKYNHQTQKYEGLIDEIELNLPSELIFPDRLIDIISYQGICFDNEDSKTPKAMIQIQ